MKTAPFRPLLAACLAFAVSFSLVNAGCGAENTPSPKPPPKVTQCQSLSELAPAFTSVVKGGKAENLRIVLERNHLFDNAADGSEPPVTTLLRVVIGTLTDMAHDPPERGAVDGELCNTKNPPAPRDANRICEVRRLITTFVHEGKGLETLKLLDPLLANALRYITGKAPAATEPHYEVAGTISDLCSKPAICRPEDTFDMLAGLLNFMAPTPEQPKRPKDLLAQLNGVLQNPNISSVRDTLNSKLMQSDLILLANLLMDNVLAMKTDPAAFTLDYHKNLEVKINDLLTNTLKISRTDAKYAALRTSIDGLLGPHEKFDEKADHSAAALYGTKPPLMFDMMNPGRPNALLVPMQRSLSCLRKVDTQQVFLQMVYALGYRTGVVGLSDIMKALEGLADSDDRGTIVNFAITMVQTIRKDDEGLTAARKLCSTLFSTAKPADGGKSNAELATPVITELFEEGAVQELICVSDTLLFGCSGGQQPACPQEVTTGP